MYKQSADIRTLQDWLAKLPVDPTVKGNLPQGWWDLYFKLGRDAGLDHGDCVYMERYCIYLMGERKRKFSHLVGKGLSAQEAGVIADKDIDELRRKQVMDLQSRKIRFAKRIQFGDFITRRQAWAGVGMWKERNAERKEVVKVEGGILALVRRLVRAKTAAARTRLAGRLHAAADAAEKEASREEISGKEAGDLIVKGGA